MPDIVEILGYTYSKALGIVYLKFKFNWASCMCLLCVLSHFSHIQLFVILLDCSSPGSSIHGIFQTKLLKWSAMPSSKGLPSPGIEPVSLMSLHWQAGSLPLVPLGKSGHPVSQFVNL